MKLIGLVRATTGLQREAGHRLIWHVAQASLALTLLPGGAACAGPLAEPAVIAVAPPASLTLNVTATDKQAITLPVTAPPTTAPAWPPAPWTVSGLQLFRIASPNCQGCMNPPAASLLPPRMQVMAGQAINLNFWNDLAPTSIPATPQSNIHVHGMLVSPTHPATACGTRGDDVFATTATGTGPCVVQSGSTDTLQYVSGKVSYHYAVPADHPPGQNWMHPHPHGQSEPQVFGGMSSLLTVGRTTDSMFIRCALPGTDAAATFPSKKCQSPVEVGLELARWAFVDVHHIMLKDIQLQLNGTAVSARPLDTASKSLCSASPPETGKGWCRNPGDSTLWAFTVNGSVYPGWHSGFAHAQVWRVANASADVTYRLVLNKAGTTNAVPFRVLGLDGATFTAAMDGSVTELTMMPGARADLLVDVCTTKTGVFVGATCTGFNVADVGLELVTQGITTGTGTAGDVWPGVALASITLDGPRSIPLARLNQPQTRTGPTIPTAPFNIQTAAPPTFAPTRSPELRAPAGPAGRLPDPATLQPVSPRANRMTGPSPMAAHQGASPQQPGAPAPTDAQRVMPPSGHMLMALPDPACTPSNPPAGQARVIRFYNGIDSASTEHFALRAEYNPFTHPAAGTINVSSSFTPPPTTGAPAAAIDSAYSQFGASPSLANVCVKYNAVETWVLINDADECHNFHIHQMRFTVLDVDVSQSDPLVASACLGGAKLAVIGTDVLHDNFPLPPKARVLITAPFTRPEQIGRFVYHCHILEHEDKGMMAIVDVRP